jgi:hypothetical protein
MKSKKSRSEDFWEAQLSAQKISGLSRREFCRQNAIKLHEFNYRLRVAQKSRSTKAGAAFARVVVNDSKRSSRDEIRAVRVNLGAGISVDVDSRIEPRWLSDLIKDLRATP